VNERRTVVGGVIGHCVSPQPWREIDAHGVYIFIATFITAVAQHIFKRILLVWKWWGKLGESNISYENSSEDVNKNTSIEQW